MCGHCRTPVTTSQNPVEWNHRHVLAKPSSTHDCSQMSQIKSRWPATTHPRLCEDRAVTQLAGCPAALYERPLKTAPGYQELSNYKHPLSTMTKTLGTLTSALAQHNVYKNPYRIMDRSFPPSNFSIQLGFRFTSHNPCPTYSDRKHSL